MFSEVAHASASRAAPMLDQTHRSSKYVFRTPASCCSPTTASGTAETPGEHQDWTAFPSTSQTLPDPTASKRPLRVLHQWAANTPSDSLGRMHSQHHDSEETEHTRRSSGPSNCPTVAIPADHRGVCPPKKEQILDSPM